jgi:LysR family pca operon transcriptional activator
MSNEIEIFAISVYIFGNQMDRRIKFRHLDAFCVIARELSLKRAAQHLHLTQPAISRTLKELEGIIGVSLMDRSRAGVRLTAEGEVFLQFAEQSRAALQQGLQSISGNRTAPGRICVGALPSVASGLIVRSSQVFLERHPETFLEVVEGPHEALTGGLRRGVLDLVVGRLGRPETMEGLIFRQLYSEEVVVVCRSDSAALSIRTFEGLGAFRVLYPPKSSAIRPLIARMLISQSIPLFSDRIESTSSSFGRAMVLHDPRVVWFISRGVVSEDLRSGRMVALDLDMKATVGSVGIMSRAEEIPAALVQSLARVLVETSRNADEQHIGGGQI